MVINSSSSHLCTAAVDGPNGQETEFAETDIDRATFGMVISVISPALPAAAANARMRMPRRMRFPFSGDRLPFGTWACQGEPRQGPARLGAGPVVIDVARRGTHLDVVRGTARLGDLR
jgi:hypothetical protein